MPKIQNPQSSCPENKEKPAPFSLKVWAKKLMDNASEPYTAALPTRTGLFYSLFFRFLTRNITTSPELKNTTDHLPPNAIILYISPRNSHFEFLFSHFRYKKLGMPSPRIGLDYSFVWSQPVVRVLKIFLAHTFFFFRHFRPMNSYERGFFKERLLQNQVGFLSLDSKTGFEDRFIHSQLDPIAHLIDLQKNCDRPIYLIPQILFLSNAPNRATPSVPDVLLGSTENPGAARRVIVSLKGKDKRVFMDFSEPVSLVDFLSKPEIISLAEGDQALGLRQELKNIFIRHRQSVTGPVLKNREEIIESILTSKKVEKILEEEMMETGKNLQAVRKRAKSSLDEIAANYSMGWIRAYSAVLSPILNRLFDGMVVDQEGLSELRKASKKGPVILVPCHKSHLDYLILSYIFYHNNMPCPHIAAGKNLSFWPLGTIFRGGGAFFLRRTFRGDKLYAQIFASYMEKLLSEGFNIEFFIEGGRSRTGKLLPPKMGLLAQILSAYANGAVPDMSIIPISLGYDRILEEKSYLHELSGGEKKPESVGALMNARKSLKVRYGKVYVNFNRPIPLRAYFSERGIDPFSMKRETLHEICNDLAYRCIHDINQVSVVTPYGIVAGALLNIFHPTVIYSQLVEVMDTYLGYLNRMKTRLADTLQVNPAYALRQVAEAFIQRGFVESAPKEDSKEDFRMILVENKRPILDYYKNNVIAFFIPAAYTALAILKQNALQFTSSELHLNYSELSEFFANEFFKDPDQSSEVLVRKNIKTFIDDAILVPHPSLPDTYNVTAAGLRKLKLFAAFLLTYFESAWVTLNFFMRYPADTVEPKNRLKKIQAMGERMEKRGEIKRIEALSGANYKNALTFFLSRDLAGSENKDKISYYTSFIQDYINLILT